MVGEATAMSQNFAFDMASLFAGWLHPHSINDTSFSMHYQA
jgi:hypothetical protein